MVWCSGKLIGTTDVPDDFTKSKLKSEHRKIDVFFKSFTDAQPGCDII